MKPIEARDQVGLGLRRCVQLAVTGMGYRLFRSLVTVSILALAVAFLVHMLSFALLERDVRANAAAWLAELRSADRAITAAGGVAPEGADAMTRARATQRRMVARLEQPGARQRAAVAFRTPVNQLDSVKLVGSIRGGDDGARLAEALGADAAGPFDPAEVAAAGQLLRREQRKSDLTAGAEADATGPMGLPIRTLWLLVLSLLVCVIGVANAMLMSVTERFTEIATMKCLGAMDRSVMTMFVAEAAIQGVVGGLIGIVLGVLLALARGLIDFGNLVFEAWAVIGPVAAASGVALLVGMVLATLAAIGPSLIAARLAPMEAMRVE